MDQEIGEWTPMGSRLDSLPANWQISVQNLLTEANTMIDDDPAFSSSQPITQLLQLVIRSNEGMEIKKCWPLKVVKKEVQFDHENHRFVYENKFGNNTILKPEQVRQCLMGTLKGHISGCTTVQKEDLDAYFETLTEEQMVAHDMEDLYEFVEDG